MQDSWKSVTEFHAYVEWKMSIFCNKLNPNYFKLFYNVGELLF